MYNASNNIVDGILLNCQVFFNKYGLARNSLIVISNPLAIRIADVYFDKVARSIFKE